MRLELTDFITTISLDGGSSLVGWSVVEYRQGLPQKKGGGQWGDSLFTDGRRMTFARLTNPVDAVELRYVGRNPDETSRALSTFTDLLDKAISYWTSHFSAIYPTNTFTDFDDRLVWLVAQDTCETNIRYAPVIGYEIPELNDQANQPFVQRSGKCILEITLVLERQIFRHRPLDRITLRSVPLAGSSRHVFDNFGGDFWLWPVNTFTTKKQYGYPQVLLGGPAQYSARPWETIKIFDTSTGVYDTHLYPWVAANMWPLPPAAGATGDIFYVGSNTPILEHYFVMAGIMSNNAIVAEYSTGPGAWAAIPGWSKATRNYNEAGVGSFVLIQYQLKMLSGLWARAAVDGVTHYWIRYVVVAPGAGVNPVISTIVPNTFDSAVIGGFNGDYTSLLKFYLDFLDSMRTIDDICPDRILIGMYSSSRAGTAEYMDSLFGGGGYSLHVANAELLMDNQVLPIGAAGIIYPNDTFQAIARSEYLNLASRTDALAVCKAYSARGRFRLLVGAKCSRSGGGDVSGYFGFFFKDDEAAGNYYTSETIYNKMFNEIEILDFGEVTLPVSGKYGQTALPGQTTLNLSVSYIGDGTHTNWLDLYWVVLIPTDEFFADIYNPSSDSLYDLAVDSVFRDTLIIDSAVIQDHSAIAAYIVQSAGALAAGLADMSGSLPFPQICSASGSLVASTHSTIKVILLGMKYEPTKKAWYHSAMSSVGLSYSYFNRYKGLRGAG